jgi:hypothetical protein
LNSAAVWATAKEIIMLVDPSRLDKAC